MADAEKNARCEGESHKKDCPRRDCVEDCRPSEFSEASLEL